MQFGGHPIQLALAIAIGAVLTFRGWDRTRVAFASGRLSFVLAAAWMLFGHAKRWYPAGQSIAAVGSWALSGWICGLLVWLIASRLLGRQNTAPEAAPLPENVS